MDEYRHFFADPAALGAQLDCLVELHGRERIAEWKALAERGEWRALVARLLEEHYDPCVQAIRSAQLRAAFERPVLARARRRRRRVRPARRRAA
jgi:hypothetical protein